MVGYAGTFKWQSLRISYSIEPWTPDHIRGDDPGQHFLEKSGAGSYFNRDIPRLTKRYETGEEFLPVDTSQCGFPLPDTTMLGQ